MQNLRERLAERTPLLGVNNNYGTTSIIEMIGPDWDWV